MVVVERIDVGLVQTLGLWDYFVGNRDMEQVGSGMVVGGCFCGPQTRRSLIRDFVLTHLELT